MKKQFCNVASISNVLGKKWTIPLLEQIALHSNKGFNFLLSRLKKVSPKVLSQRLKELESNGLIVKKALHHSKFLSTEYIITNKGMEIYEIARKLKEFNAKHSGSADCVAKECITCENL